MKPQSNIRILTACLIAVGICTLLIGRQALAVAPNPTLLSPADSAAILRAPILFDWNDMNGVAGYGIELLNDVPENPNGNTPSTHRIAAALSGGNTSEFQGDASYLPPGTYYWRTIAVKNNALYGGFSDARSFSIPAWPAPTLASPADGYVQPAHGIIEFNWEDMPGVTGYGIELLSGSPENPGGQTASRHRLTAALSPGGFSQYPGDTSGLTPGTYWWRVIGVRNGTLYGLFSEARSFSVPVWPGVVLTSSFKGSGLTSPFAGFSWAASPGAIGYGVEILNALPESSEANGVAPSVHRVAAFTALGNSCSFDMRELPPGVYYYRVIAYNSNYMFIGGFSDIDTFSTVIMPGVTLKQAYNYRYLASYLPIVHWDPVPRAIGYGVEILSAPPEPGERYGKTPSVHRIAAVSGGHGAMELDLRGYKPGVYYYRVIAWDAGDNFIFGFSNCDSFTIPLNLDRPMEVRLGTSVQGRPIMATRHGSGRRKVLLVGGHHGDEPRSMTLLANYNAYLYGSPGAIPANTEIWIVTCLNPDGLAADTRLNARGVNLNRNYATSDWGTAGTDTAGSYPGPYPMSEPETQAIRTLCDMYGMKSMISYHEWEGCVYAGPFGAGLANVIAPSGGLATDGPTIASGYATLWFGETYGGPSATVELSGDDSGSSDAAIFSKMLPGLTAAVNY